MGPSCMVNVSKTGGRTGELLRRVMAVTFLSGLAILSQAAAADDGAAAAAVPTPAPTPAPAPAPGSQRLEIPADCILRDHEGRFLGWFDYEHCLLSGDAMASANRFDNYFGNWHSGEARLLVRVVAEEQWDRKTGYQLAQHIQALTHLPNADQRLRLVISDDRNELFGPHTDQSPEYLQQQSSATVAALRFIGFATDTLRLDTDAGLRSGPDVFLRARASESTALGRETVFQTGEMLRYAARDRGRVDVHADLQREVGDPGVLRLGNDLSYWQKEDHLVGARWSQGISWSQSLGPQRSIAVGISTAGVTRPVWARQSYGPWLLFRTALYSDWVFCEVQPQLTRYAQYNWRTVPSLTLRLEVQFGRD